jgi:hypothetical protein
VSVFGEIEVGHAPAELERNENGGGCSQAGDAEGNQPAWLQPPVLHEQTGMIIARTSSHQVRLPTVGRTP